MVDEEGKGQWDELNNLDWKQVAERLNVDIETGLLEEEAQKRTSKFGFNEIPENKESPVLKFLSKFWGLTAWMLELTILISFILCKYLDMYIIGALLLFNSILSFLQEEKASSIISSLKKNLQVEARVLRERKWKLVPARELVPGDIVRVRAGDFVVADLKIITGELEADQSALTGESLEVEKNENSVLYSGSIVKEGEANSIVLATGKKTYFGRTTQLVQIARPKLHMEEIISKVVTWLLVIVILLLGLTLLVLVARGGSLLEILPLTLLLLVTAVPVALPAMFTLSTALGSIELAKQGVLVTKLTASEDVATMDTLCADKTGTITMNKLTITNISPVTGFVENDVILYGALASQEANMDPIDLAFLTFAKDKKLLGREYVQKEFYPFAPKTKRTEAIIQRNNSSFRVMKGAVRTIGGLCGLKDEELDRLENSMEELVRKGYRTLAVAINENTEKPKLVGLVAMYDNPMPDSIKLIQELKCLGISVKMLTGDALPVAKEIANKVGLEGNIVKAPDLKKYATENLITAAEIAEKSDGFAEIYPEDKYIIIKSLQSKHHIVGMTGDGVNDAPALKQAEVGIAVSNATDVAKRSASVVLTSEGLSSIVDLIKTGRMVYQRIISWTLNKIIKTFTIVVFITLSFMLTNLFVVSAFDMVLLLLLTDFVTLSLATDKVRWSHKPDIWNITELVKVAVALGVLILIEHFGLLFIGLKYFGLQSSLPELNTFVFEMLFFSGAFTIFMVRERGHFWNSIPSRTLIFTILLDMIFVGAISTFGIPGLVPLPLYYTLCIVVYYFVLTFLVNDSMKYLLIKYTGMAWQSDLQ